MAGITLQEAEETLAAYRAALTAVLKRQSYELNGRRLTMADLKDIEAGIDRWDARVKNLSRQSTGRSRARTIVPGG